MRSLRWKIALWYAAGLFAVLCLSITVTHSHLRHELRMEKWERGRGSGAGQPLHGSYSDPEIDDIIGELWNLSLFYAIPLGFASLALGYMLASRSLRPMERLRAQLDGIGSHNLASRVSLDDADGELRAIEGNINALLARLGQSFGQLSEYSAQVAHELRTPLTLLRLQVEENADRMEPALAESLQDELKRLSDYVDQSLLLATAAQGRLELRRERLSVGNLLAELAETYELWARTEQRSLSIQGSGELHLYSDPRYLRQVLHSLLSNAMQHGSGAILVSYGRSGEKACCRIENALASSRPQRAGTGIGLRVARAVAEALGCRLHTHSEKGCHIAELTWDVPAGEDAPSGAKRPEM